jgi:hypothetical protein
MQILQIIFLSTLAPLLVACGDRSSTPTNPQAAPSSCRGIYYETDNQGNLMTLVIRRNGGPFRKGELIPRNNNICTQTHALVS